MSDFTYGCGEDGCRWVCHEIIDDLTGEVVARGWKTEAYDMRGDGQYPSNFRKATCTPPDPPPAGECPPMPPKPVSPTPPTPTRPTFLPLDGQP